MTTGARFTTITGSDWAKALPSARQRRKEAKERRRELIAELELAVGNGGRYQTHQSDSFIGLDAERLAHSWLHPKPDMIDQLFAMLFGDPDRPDYVSRLNRIHHPSSEINLPLP